MREAAEVTWITALLLLLLSILITPAVCQQKANEKQETKSSYKCAARQNNAAKGESKPEADESKRYVGGETCQSCHVITPESFSEGTHGKGMSEICGMPLSRTCETCHGPAREHVDTGGDQDKIIVFRTLSAKEVNRRCLACHGLSQNHKEFFDPEKAKMETSCLSCHAIHHPSKPKASEP